MPQILVILLVSLMLGCSSKQKAGDIAPKPQAMKRTVEETIEFFDKRMTELKSEPIRKRLPPSVQRVTEFEHHLGVTLPADYRAFLLKHAGVSTSSTCPFQEPSPCGDNATIERFYGFMPDGLGHLSLAGNSDLANGPPWAIPIAENMFGDQIILFIQGEQTGAVYFFDHEQRYFWSDEQFRSMFPNLAPEIDAYLKLRRDNKLPKKPAGMESFYRLAPTFSDFISACKYWDLNAEDDQTPTKQ